ncbi:MAG: transposase [Gammaproteobacteria bacterium]|nr:transposase [Gammaproteobacteria bacterium]MDE0271447.1 transposase [Gammaproteobacteria bacterium]
MTMGDGKIIRAVRYRVLPGTRAKARRLNRLAGACRHVWNWALDRQNAAWLGWLFSSAGRPPAPTFFTLGKAFTALRNSGGHEWLRELPFAEVRYTLKHQADAWSKFLKGDRGHPKFKGRGGAAGFTVPERVRIADGFISVPKLGSYRLRRGGGNPWPDGKPRQAVFKREGGKWFCTVFYEVAIDRRPDDGTVVGVDRNVGQCALSTGEIIRLPNLARLEARKRRYQRRMARQAKGGGRRNRTKAKLARTHACIRGIRSNWCHQASRRISDAAHTIAIEDLNTKGMTKSAKGTEEEPGTNVRAKSGLNRSVLSSGWGWLERNLDYKAGKVMRVNPAFTSQACNKCGHVDAGNRPDQSTFRCQACGYEANADVNAALNIRRQGLARLDGEGRRCSRASPMNRQTGGELRQAA